jgi:hypothetical protein
MKRSFLHQRPGLLFGMAVVCAIGASVVGADAATITPGATGSAPVAAAIAGRANLALASAGSLAFSSSDLTPDYAFPRVNDGVIDNLSGNSWIALTTAAGEFVGVTLSAPANVSAVVWHGQTGYNGRSAGTWRLEYTTDASPTGASSWTEIGTYTYAEPGCASPMPRSFFSFAPISGVTGLRLLLGAATCSAQLCVQEFEAYEAIETPPSITGQPTGGTAAEGGDFTFQVTAEGAESFQWRKNGNNIPGATGPAYTLSNVKTNDAGTYTVLAINPAGTVPSDPAVLIVTPAPVFATYTEAILTDNPIHYYPLDETAGTTATIWAAWPPPVERMSGASLWARIPPPLAWVKPSGSTARRALSSILDCSILTAAPSRLRRGPGSIPTRAPLPITRLWRAGMAATSSTSTPPTRPTS